MTSLHLTLESVDKFIQIGKMIGNVNIQGNIEKAIFNVGDDFKKCPTKISEARGGLTLNR